MRFWIDENVHAHVAKALKQAGHEIRIAKRGTDDKGLQSCTHTDSPSKSLSTEPHV
jgi:predicted nuclease of predicted toxin-antitoxin system